VAAVRVVEGAEVAVAVAAAWEDLAAAVQEDLAAVVREDLAAVVREDLVVAVQEDLAAVPAGLLAVAVRVAPLDLAGGFHHRWVSIGVCW
jgi:hypothetical protein